MLLNMDWKNFRSIHGEEGSRSKFEDLVYDLLCREYPSKKVHKTDSSRGGDGGIDIFVERDGGIDIYQCKFFPDKMENAQWQQIVASFESSMRTAERDGVKVLEWYLCTPFISNRDPVGPWKRWSQFVEKNAGRIVDSVEWLDGARIIQKLEQPDLVDLQIKYFTIGESVLRKEGVAEEDNRSEDRGKFTSIHVAANVHPKVFISYSWTSEEYKNRVLNLATRLRNKGVDVILDQWDLRPGHDMYAFMEQSIHDADKVLILCDSGYTEKADNRSGGVGAETQIITPDVYGKHKQEKFIPVIMETPKSVPSYLKSRYAVFYTKDEKEELLALCHAIFGVSRAKKPPVGEIPIEWLQDEGGKPYKVTAEHGKASNGSTEIKEDASDSRMVERGRAIVSKISKKEKPLGRATVSTEKEFGSCKIADGRQSVAEASAKRQHLILHKGDKYEFGHYPKERDGKDEPLLWRVLDVDTEKGRALLITENLIDCRKYHEKLKGITWEECDLRKWMNGEFIDRTFDKEDLGNIAEMPIQNPDNTVYGTKGCRATPDKVFALSIDEADKYFRDDVDRRAAVTPYAESHGSARSDSYTTVDGQPAGWWWLRSPGYHSNHASVVTPGVGVYSHGNGVINGPVSVRPALWLNL